MRSSCFWTARTRMMWHVGTLLPGATCLSQWSPSPTCCGMEAPKCGADARSGTPCCDALLLEAARSCASLGRPSSLQLGRSLEVGTCCGNMEARRVPPACMQASGIMLRPQPCSAISSVQLSVCCRRLYGQQARQLRNQTPRRATERQQVDKVAAVLWPANVHQPSSRCYSDEVAQCVYPEIVVCRRAAGAGQQ